MGNQNESSLKQKSSKDNINNDINDSKTYYDIDEKTKTLAYNLEEELLSKFCSEFTRDQLYFEDVPVSVKNFDNMYMRTLILNGKELNTENNTKKTLIMLHGFQACNLTYYRMLKYLGKDFIVFCPDFLGMGLSSRPKVDFANENECIEFFVEVIEAFRKAKNINKFYLCGYSLGGYYAGQYSIKYPQYLEDTIFLFSATGIGNHEKGGDPNENTTVGQKLVFKGNFGAFKMKPRMQSFKNKFIAGLFVNNKCKSRYDIPPDEAEMVGKINMAYLDYPKDLDDCIYIIFKYPIPTMKIPLEDLFLEKIPDKKIVFCYGEKDWMDKFGAKRLAATKPEKYKYYDIKNWGHNWLVESPIDATNIIKSELNIYYIYIQ